MRWPRFFQFYCHLFIFLGWGGGQTGGGASGGPRVTPKSSASMSDCRKRLSSCDIFMLPRSRLQSTFSVAPALKARKVDGCILERILGRGGSWLSVGGGGSRIRPLKAHLATPPLHLQPLIIVQSVQTMFSC